MCKKQERRHILSISGGKDSAALAIYMMETRNIENMEYVFMDTEQELPETYEFLDRLEGVIGASITRLKPKWSFEKLLKLHNGFLPSAQARWCTSMMKIKPFELFIGDSLCYSYIGIRGDENRAGFISSKDNIKPMYPFVEDGITLADVNRILDEAGLGLPKYYDWRSRSGCYFCFFQQNIEWVGLKENHPELFEKARGFEKGDFSWNERGDLSQYEEPKRVAEIKARHEKLIKSKKKLPKGAKLIDIMRECDPFEDADAFDAVMREQEHEEGCLVCTL
jgi:hypothetical protein